MPYIDEVALTFPALKIICGHIGYPWTEEMIGVAWKHKNVYIGEFIVSVHQIQLIVCDLYVGRHFGMVTALLSTSTGPFHANEREAQSHVWDEFLTTPMGQVRGAEFAFLLSYYLFIIYYFFQKKKKKNIEFYQGSTPRPSVLRWMPCVVIEAASGCTAVFR